MNPIRKQLTPECSIHSQSAADIDVLHEMIKALYREDQGTDISDEHIERTLQEMQKYPEKGALVVFEHAKEVIGYAILITYWSNEFGGTVLHIDELFLLPSFRGKGFGTAFIQYCIEERPFNAVQLSLETTATNSRARKLYAQLGFHSHPNTTHIRELT